MSRFGRAEQGTKEIEKNSNTEIFPELDRRLLPMRWIFSIQSCSMTIFFVVIYILAVKVSLPWTGSSYVIKVVVEFELSDHDSMFFNREIYC